MRAVVLVVIYGTCLGLGCMFVVHHSLILWFCVFLNNTFLGVRHGWMLCPGLINLPHLVDSTSVVKHLSSCTVPTGEFSQELMTVPTCDSVH